MKKTYIFSTFLITSLLVIGCSQNTDTNNQSIESNTVAPTEETLNNTNDSSTHDSEHTNKTNTHSYKEMSDLFFEFTDKQYDINQEDKDIIVNTTKAVLNEIGTEKNEKFNLSIITDESTAMNNSSKTLKLNLNQIYGLKELTKLPLDTVTKASVLHELGHYYTPEMNNLVNSLLFDSIMNEVKVFELTEEELNELIIAPEETAWEFTEKYMDIKDYELVKKYALSTYYASYEKVIASNEPIEYNDTFSIKLKK